MLWLWDFLVRALLAAAVVLLLAGVIYGTVLVLRAVLGP